MQTCANCNAILAGEYCQDCGQRRFVESDRKLGHLLHQFVASATDVDGRIWRSVRALLFHPGLLSREYFAGRRAKWLSPVSLFLAISVLYFLSPLHGGDLTLQFNQHVAGRLRALANDGTEKLSPEQISSVGQPHSAITDGWIDARVAQRDKAARDASAGAKGYSYQDYRVAYDAKADDVSKALVILHVPFAALALMIVFARRHRYFAEHFVVAMHFFSFAIVALLIVVQTRALLHFLLPPSAYPPEWTFDWIMRTLLPLYAVLSLRRAYGIGWIYATFAALVLVAAMVFVNIYVYRSVQFVATFALT